MIDKSLYMTSLYICGQAISFSFCWTRMCRLMMALSCETEEVLAHIYIHTYIPNVITCKEKEEASLFSLSLGKRRRNSWKSTKLILMLMTSDSLERKKREGKKNLVRCYYYCSASSLFLHRWSFFFSII